MKILLLLLFPSIAFAQTNICFTAGDNSLHSEVFVAPSFTPDFGPVQYLTNSPIDPTRDLNNLPSFGLAAWHHWLFSMSLLRAQRQYAACVARIEAYEELLGLPLVSSPQGGLRDLINSIREYEVPFNATSMEEPSRPPTREEMIKHAFAALYTYNVVVFHIGLCEGGAAILKTEVKRKLRRR